MKSEDLETTEVDPTIPPTHIRMKPYDKTASTSIAEGPPDETGGVKIPYERVADAQALGFYICHTDADDVEQQSSDQPAESVQPVVNQNPPPAGEPAVVVAEVAHDEEAKGYLVSTSDGKDHFVSDALLADLPDFDAQTLEAGQPYPFADDEEGNAMGLASAEEPKADDAAKGDKKTKAGSRRRL